MQWKGVVRIILDLVMTKTGKDISVLYVYSMVHFTFLQEVVERMLLRTFVSIQIQLCGFFGENIICLASLTRAKPKEKNEICRSISTRAVKCDGVFFILQHGFQYGFQHA